VRTKVRRIDPHRRRARGRRGGFRRDRLGILKPQVQQRRQLARHADVREAIAAIAGDLDIEHDIAIAALLKMLDRQPAARERITGAVRVELCARKKIGEPLQAGVHSPETVFAMMGESKRL
jgi:hypothetical protein